MCNNYKRKRLVSSGAGFIGSQLVDWLIAGGHNVVVLDNFVTARPENLRHLRDKPRFSISRADGSYFDAIYSCVDGIELGFHLAALAEIVPSIKRPLDYYHANAGGTVAMLESARAAGDKRFVNAASFSCYSIPDSYPKAETAAIRPQHF